METILTDSYLKPQEVTELFKQASTLQASIPPFTLRNSLIPLNAAKW